MTQTARASVQVLFRDMPPAVQLHGADLLIDGRDAVGRENAGVVPASGRKLGRRLRGRMPDEIALLLDGTDIVVGEANVMPNALSPRLAGGSARPENDQIGAHRGEHVAVAAFETLPDGDHEHNRGNAPGDAEHGQGAAQLMRPDVAQGLNQDFDGEDHVTARPAYPLPSVPPAPRCAGHWRCRS